MYIIKFIINICDSTTTVNQIVANSGVPMWCSGLRIWCYPCLGSGLCCGTGLTPGQGSSTCHVCGQKKKEANSVSFPMCFNPYLQEAVLLLLFPCPFKGNHVYMYP